MFATAYAIRTVFGGADSWRAAAFGILALGFLGMDGGRRSVRIPLCSSFPESADERKREEYATWGNSSCEAIRCCSSATQYRSNFWKKCVGKSTGKSSLTISRKPDGVGAGSQLWIARNERSGLLTRIAPDVKLLSQTEPKPTAFHHWRK